MLPTLISLHSASLKEMDYVYLIVSILCLCLSCWLFQYAGESISLILLVLIGVSDTNVGRIVFPGVILYAATRRWLVTQSCE
jgi:threonine/homoserine efflux transporter RhtA